MSDAYVHFSVEDIGIDNDGRVLFADPQLAVALEAAKRLGRDKAKPKPPPPNTNCDYCNTVKGCGPINNVEGCGSKLRE